MLKSHSLSQPLPTTTPVDDLEFADETEELKLPARSSDSHAKLPFTPEEDFAWSRGMFSWEMFP